MNQKKFLSICYLFVIFGLALKLIFWPDSPPESAGTVSLLNSTQEQGFTQTHADAAAGGTEQAWVKRTVDGDTLDVLVGGTEEKVRLLGINSPESVDPRKPVECYGKEASHQMDLLATHHNVTMTGDPANENRDKYKRLLRYVYLEDGTFVNSRMVEQGNAFAYTTYPFQYEKMFTDLELKARQSELGLWNSKLCAYDKTN